jgi:DNA-binding transcriptional regulator YdaS (Cro superfamily)
MSNKDASNTVNDVVEYFGGQYKLAAALNVSSVAVSHWVKCGTFPPRRAMEIQKLSEDKFNAFDLISYL